MAANLRDIKIHHKRKLEDIKKDPSSIMKDSSTQHKKLKVSFKGVYGSPEEPRSGHHLRATPGAPSSPPRQQRSPSPTDISPKHDHDHDHDHLHPLQHLHHYEGPEKQFENSPLLTPKDEDEDDEEYSKSYDCTPPSSTNDTNNDPNEKSTDLNTNTDYLALSSSLRLLNSNKKRISDEIVQLSELSQFHLQNDNKAEIIAFFMKLINNELHLPQPSKVLKAPTIDWSRYHPSLDRVSKTFEKELTSNKKDEADYKAVQLFEK